MTSIRQISQLFTTNDKRSNKDLDRKKYATLLKYASQSTFSKENENLNDHRNIASTRDSDKRLGLEGMSSDSDGDDELKIKSYHIPGLTLEEKILCGFYTAKPQLNEAYPSMLLNRPNAPAAN